MHTHTHTHFLSPCLAFKWVNLSVLAITHHLMVLITKLRIKNDYNFLAGVSILVFSNFKINACLFKLVITFY